MEGFLKTTMTGTNDMQIILISRCPTIDLEIDTLRPSSYVDDKTYPYVAIPTKPATSGHLYSNSRLKMMTFCVNILTPNPHDILSPSVQNELLNICGIIIRDTVVTTCNNAQYFTVLAYETTDKSAKEQLCICVRYVSNIGETEDNFCWV